MNEDKTKNQAPILKFLNKHKWRIIFPILATVIYFLYFAIPGYFDRAIMNRYDLFITSTQNWSNKQLQNEIVETLEQVKSDEFTHNLIVKHDLFAEDRKKGVDEEVLIDRLKRGMYLQSWGDNIETGVPVEVLTQIKNEEPQKIAAVNREIVSQLEQQQNFRISSKFTYAPYDGNVYREWVLFGRVIMGAMFSALLIFIWEIPSLFYSPRTKEMVFEPLQADWQSELLDAKLRNQTWKAFQINVRYSYAFLAAIIQKSPVGSLIESVNRFAR